MRKIISVVIATLVFISTVAAVPYPVINGGTKTLPIWPEIYEAITLTCRTVIVRVEADHVEESALPECIKRFSELFDQDEAVVWPNLDQIKDTANGIIQRWDWAWIRSHSAAYGCSSYGCPIGYKSFVGGRVEKVIEEEMINMGEILRKIGYGVPIY